MVGSVTGWSGVLTKRPNPASGIEISPVHKARKYAANCRQNLLSYGHQPRRLTHNLLWCNQTATARLFCSCTYWGEACDQLLTPVMLTRWQLLYTLGEACNQLLTPVMLPRWQLVQGDLARPQVKTLQLQGGKCVHESLLYIDRLAPSLLEKSFPLFPHCCIAFFLYARFDPNSFTHRLSCRTSFPMLCSLSLHLNLKLIPSLRIHVTVLTRLKSVETMTGHQHSPSASVSILLRRPGIFILLLCGVEVMMQTFIFKVPQSRSRSTLSR